MAAAQQRLTRPLLLVGCGKMGGAMLSGWLESGIVGAGVAAIDPLGAPDFAASGQVTVYDAMAALPDDLDPEVVVFAVKPQQMDEAAPAAARFAGPGTVFLSIAAGKPISYFTGHLGQDAAITPRRRSARGSRWPVPVTRFRMLRSPCVRRCSARSVTS
jgi:pyrroline-5-carboxylate reductase